MAATQIKSSANQFPKKVAKRPVRPHNRFNSSLSRTRLRRCSDALRTRLELYKDLRREFLIGKMCEYPQEPFGCLNQASEVHHRKGRGKYLLDRRTWLATCRPHHVWIEENKRTARKIGVITYK